MIWIFRSSERLRPSVCCDFSSAYPDEGETGTVTTVNTNVKINFDNRVAVTSQAVYNTETRVLVLSGDNSRIISGKDSISGEKITLYRTTGGITVESSKDKRVEAVLYSGEKGLK